MFPWGLALIMEMLSAITRNVWGIKAIFKISQPFLPIKLKRNLKTNKKFLNQMFIKRS